MVKAASTEEKLLRVEDVAQLLKLSKRQVFRLNSAGLICASIKVGHGAVRWRQTEILQWIGMGCPDRAEWEATKDAGK